MSNSPRRQAGVAAELRYPVPFGYLIGAASYAWKDSYNTGAANDPTCSCPASAWPTCRPASSRPTAAGACWLG